MDDDTKAQRSFGVSPAEKNAMRLLGTVDPCVDLLQEWEHAHHMAVVLCRLQQRLETRIRNALASSDSGGERRQTSTSTVADSQARWDALDHEVGYSRTRHAELQAVEAELEILDSVAATRARSLRGVVAKLRIIVGGGENTADPSAFPWPQIQSALDDLEALGDPGIADPLSALASHVPRRHPG